MFKKIGITGDTHGDLSLIRINRAIKEGFDCLIVTGDFGYLWEGSEDEVKALNKIKSLPITILFVDGNHENFDLLNTYKVSTWNGGKVRFIRKNIIHLMRGQVFEIDNKKFFTFGGAKSVDIFNRKENVDWWREELPNLKEMDEGIDNLQKHNNKVDYIITHTCYEEILSSLVRFSETDELIRYLSFIKMKIQYNMWYFGHFHIDYNINDKDFCLYHLIKEL